MKKALTLVAVVTALFSNQLVADEISGGARVNLDSGQLIVPCVEVDDPGSEFDGRFFDAILDKSENSYELIYAEEEDPVVCKQLIEASLKADEDTLDINGDLGTTYAINAPIGAASWVGLIGVDYQPNHYDPANHIFNTNDVFYAGMSGSGRSVSNVYLELAQLKAAGFTVVRSYQVAAYSWIDLIKQANALGLSVIYEAPIPFNGNQASIDSAIQVLNHVIEAVGVTIFQKTVVMVFAGHENYDSKNNNIQYLTSAIQQIQAALANKGVPSVPVGTALVSGNLVTPDKQIIADMQMLINTSSASAPLGFDPYPFQYGVTPPDEAASNATLENSIAYDYGRAKDQPFYQAPKPILMAETGWATAGDPRYNDYACSILGTCQPNIASAAEYLQDLYDFVRKPGNTSSALVFEAYDEPAKATPAANLENHYGIFDADCTLKGNNSNLLPNTGFDPATNVGCHGFTKGSMFSVAGTQPDPDAKTSQPPFTVEIQQINPTTNMDASISVKVPTLDRTDTSVHPWPHFLLFDGASIKITGITSGASCRFTAKVTATPTGGAIAWTTVNCTNPSYTVNCNQDRVCYLPWNNF